MANQPTGPAQNPPPELPNMPDVSSTLTNYLRTFSLWAQRRFTGKLDANVALNGVMMQAYDAPAGTNPNVYLLRVNQAGNFVSTPVPLGSGKP